MINTNVQDSANGVIDAVVPVRQTENSAKPLSITTGRELMSISGWGVSADSTDPLVDLTVLCDGEAIAKTHIFVNRLDVALSKGLQSAKLGYRAVAPLPPIPGLHHVACEAYHTSGIGPVRFGRIAVAVVSPTITVSRGVEIDGFELEGVLKSPDASFRFGEIAVVTGWAVDVDFLCAPAAVAVIVDDKFAFNADSLIERQDVSTMTSCASDKFGFHCKVPTHWLGLGTHTIRAVAARETGELIGYSGKVLVLDVI